MLESRPNTRAALARLSLIGIPMAVLLAGVSEWRLVFLHRLYVEHFAGGNNPALGLASSPDLDWHWLNDRTFVLVIGLIALVAGGFLMPLLKKNSEYFKRYWCSSGLAVLCGSVVGYLVDAPCYRMGLQNPARDLFFRCLWSLTLVAVVFVLARRGLPLNASTIHCPPGRFDAVILARCAVFLGAGGLFLVVWVLSLTRTTPSDGLPTDFVANAISTGLSPLVSIALGYFVLSFLEKRMHDRATFGNDDRLLPRADRNYVLIVAVLMFAVETSYVGWQLLSQGRLFPPDAFLALYAPLAYDWIPLLAMLIHLRLAWVLGRVPAIKHAALLLAVSAGLSALLTLVDALNPIVGDFPAYWSVRRATEWAELLLVLFEGVVLAVLVLRLRWGTTILRAVYILPLLRILPLLAERLIDRLFLRAETWTPILNRLYSLKDCTIALLTAAYLVTLSLILSRARLTEHRSES